MITTGVVCREFIGRTVELQFLLERAARARDGRGATLIVRGSAGVGKSRLAHELAAALAGQGIRVARASCWDGDAPYAPLIEVAETLGSSDAVALLQAAENDAATNSARERARRFAAFSAALSRTAANGPVVAIVDDVHWADLATLELLRFLTVSLKAHPVVLVGTMRGDEEREDPAASRALVALEREADATVALEALGPAEMRSLLASVIRDDGRRVPAVIVDEIAELSDGRPFHAEELLRGMLERRAGNETAGSLVPRSLRVAVRERLAALSEYDRIVLAYAAVIGRRFSADFLGELTAWPMTDVLKTIRRARDLQIIVEEADGSHFVFRHALTREVVYGEILFAEARALHKRIAHALESCAAEDRDVAAIAYHAWRSGDDALTERWNDAAGDAAAAICAHVDAIKHYDRAYAAAPAAERRAELAGKAAAALYAIGDIEAATQWLDRALADARVSGDTTAARRIALERARALFESGRFQDGIDAACAVTAELANDDSALRFHAETMSAGLLAAIARPHEAIAHLDAAAALRTAPEPAWAARHRGIYAHSLLKLRRYDESRTAFAAAETLARELGDRELVVRTLNNWAELDTELGDLRSAMQRYRDAIALARDLNASRLVAWLAENMAYCALLLGDFALARELIAESSAIDHGVPIVRVLTSAVALRLGTLTGDAALVRSANIEASIAEAFTLGDVNTIAMTAGALLQHRLMTGADMGELPQRAFDATSAATDWYWLADALTRCAPHLVTAMRERLAAAAAEPANAGAQAHLLLFDARLAAREKRRDAAGQLAREAAARFGASGWAVEEGYAREVAGNVKAAIGLFRRIGAHGEVARLTAVDRSSPRRRGESSLTPREREIAKLIAEGRTNRMIAEALVISERTVETHVAAVYQKLGVTNRRDLTALLRASV